jgi:oxalate decarboxylase/phosphoglucose isomerase-like protein (cupin superfamily)
MGTQQGLYVPNGKHRFGEAPKIWGTIPLQIKVSTDDTDGALFVFEHADMGIGGPPRHFHYEQDEWFYAIKGDFVFEVGDSRWGPVIRCSRPAWSRTPGRTSARTPVRCS